MAKAFSGLGVTAGLAADRAALTGMVAGQEFFETDTKLLKVWDGLAWVSAVSGLTASGDLTGTYPSPTYKNYTICTSTTRPASPSAGQQIFETDTELLLVYSSAAWKVLGGKTPHFRAGFTNTANTGLANSFDIRRNIGFSIVSSTRITPAYSGVYTVLASQINDADTTRYDLQIRKTGVLITQALNDNSSGYHYKQIGVSVELTAGVDYIEIYADEYYNHGSTTDFWKNCSLVWDGSI